MDTSRKQQNSIKLKFYVAWTVTEGIVRFCINSIVKQGFDFLSLDLQSTYSRRWESWTKSSILFQGGKKRTNNKTLFQNRRDRKEEAPKTKQEPLSQELFLYFSTLFRNVAISFYFPFFFLCVLLNVWNVDFNQVVKGEGGRTEAKEQKSSIF